MGLATILVLIGLILAIVSLFVRDHSHRLLTAAVVLIGIGVLASGGDIGT